MNDTRETHAGFEGLESLGAELRAIDDTLARVGSIDRDAIPSGLADRIAAATEHRLEASNRGVIGRMFAFTGASGTSWGLRIAAMIGLAAAVGSAWLSMRPAASSTSTSRIAPVTVAVAKSVEQDIESWLSITNATDSEVAQLSLDSQEIDAATISDPGADSWILDGEPL
ncbi:MAG TPA: hypothetical protein VK176_00635 [Phycisphaerales bacterium]|nr:hypothetical protein [Phycisphaerales bacterium]